MDFGKSFLLHFRYQPYLAQMIYNMSQGLEIQVEY